MKKNSQTGFYKIASASTTCLLLLILFSACRDKYMPNIKTPVNGFLVVEGYINTGDGPTSFMLSRATGLDSVYIHPETGAQAEVQGENGSNYPLAEHGGGKYSIDQLTVDPGQQYRLHIKTSNGKEYQSEFAEVKISPPIDQVDWKADADGVNISVSTHDEQNKTRYYQWEFTETWQYNSAFRSFYIYENDTVRVRTASETIPFYCWRTDSSTSIVIASSAKLAKDVIAGFPLTKIPYLASDRLTTRYSILVKQFALTREWYEWKQKVKKNTEQLGSIFDAQPSGTGGNIHCITEPGETVVGFIGCSTQSEKRIFITHGEVPSAVVYTGYEDCMEVSKGNNPEMLRGIFMNNSAYITSIIPGSGPGGVIEIGVAVAECVDCRLKGGSSTKPDFW